jgi:nitric oxide reductase NorE protein
MTVNEARTRAANPLDELPGELLMWVLIVSELLVFGAALAAFLAVRATDPAGFAESQALLHREAGALNTLVLVTSGLFAALATQAALAERAWRCRGLLAAASGLGGVFLVVKVVEYWAKASQGIGTETHPFFTFYYLVTGFHAMHVVAGMVVLAIVAVRARAAEVETGAAFWHMVDLVWVLLFPVIYLLG